MDLNLRINETCLQPGTTIDNGMLMDADFRKVGLVQRFFQRLPRDHDLYIADNCTIDCFGDRLSLFPCTHDYLTKDRQWQTRASVLVVGDQIKKVDFHVLEGVYAAPNSIETFQIICNENFGSPEKLQPNHYRWKNKALSFSSYLHSDSITADFCIETLE